VRLVIEGFGRRMVDLEVWSPLSKPVPVPVPVPAAAPERDTAAAPERDTASTLSSQVEQASEPAPGFGFHGSASTLMCREPAPVNPQHEEGVLCSS
jgi:hypothetical protein